MAFTSDQLRSQRIAVLLGGPSAEREVSLRSGAAVACALRRRGFDVTEIDAGRDLAARLVEARIEVAFLALHGRWGEDGCVQGLLEFMGIPYTGSGVLASALGMDKVATKRVLAAQGLPLADWIEVPEGAGVSVGQLPFGLPCVVKPSREGSSVGVHVVKSEAELAPALEDASRHKGAVLVEKYVKGREINVAVLGDRALGAIEIVPANGFYDYAAKYTAGTTRYVFPAPLDQENYDRVCSIALDAHRALGCSGATRTDLIVGDSGETIVLEVNTLPGMTETSLLPKIAEGVGIGFDELCERILCDASLKA